MTPRRFGQALYALAREENLTQPFLEELSVLDGAFSSEPDFLRLLGDPAIPKAERLIILDDSFRGKLHPYLLNFLKLLAEKRQIRHFSVIFREFHKLYDRDSGILPVTVTTAIPLNDGLKSKLIRKLTIRTGYQIRLEYRIDPEILGGIRLDLNGFQMDGTVRRRLDEIRQQLQS